jgi:hypothetical protein
MKDRISEEESTPQPSILQGEESRNSTSKPYFSGLGK